MGKIPWSYVGDKIDLVADPRGTVVDMGVCGSTCSFKIPLNKIVRVYRASLMRGLD